MNISQKVPSSNVQRFAVLSVYFADKLTKRVAYAETHLEIAKFNARITQDRNPDALVKLQWWAKKEVETCNLDIFKFKLVKLGRFDVGDTWMSSGMRGASHKWGNPGGRGTAGLPYDPFSSIL